MPDYRGGISPNHSQLSATPFFLVLDGDFSNIPETSFSVELKDADGNPVLNRRIRLMNTSIYSDKKAASLKVQVLFVPNPTQDDPENFAFIVPTLYTISVSASINGTTTPIADVGFFYE